jgi:hypothetical protein
VSDSLGHVARQTPGTRLSVSLSLRSVGCSQRRNFKLWMILKQLNKALTDNAGGSQDSYAKLICHAITVFNHRGHRENLKMVLFV